MWYKKLMLLMFSVRQALSASIDSLENSAESVVFFKTRFRPATTGGGASSPAPIGKVRVGESVSMKTSMDVRIVMDLLSGLFCLRLNSRGQEDLSPIGGLSTGECVILT